MIASDSLEGVIDGTKRVQVPPSLMNLDLGGKWQQAGFSVGGEGGSRRGEGAKVTFIFLDSWKFHML